ncbi:MAG TPA: Hsp20/alpha crystallin family protein [Chloroflexota bacterium]|nr:Hsp20/alpha crystallin family protein [Chloroflexota bacterium]
MMNLTMRRPGDAFASSIDTIFERLLTPSAEASVATNTAPVREAPIDLWETDSAYHAALLTPGLSADSIQVSIEDGRVTVAAERKALAIEGARALWAEFGAASYRRTFRLGAAVDAAQAQATYQDGVLRLVLPKSPESQPRRIAVQVPGTTVS